MLCRSEGPCRSPAGEQLQTGDKKIVAVQKGSFPYLAENISHHLQVYNGQVFGIFTPDQLH